MRPPRRRYDDLEVRPESVILHRRRRRRDYLLIAGICGLAAVGLLIWLVKGR